VLVILSAAFFLAVEFYQASQGFNRYIKNFWNYVDILPLAFAAFGPLLTLIGYDIKPKSLQVEGEEDEFPVFRRARSIAQVGASMILWMKFLYYLRTQKQFGYLIRMITQVIKDMIPFLIVMLVLIIAFSESIYSIDNNKFSEEHTFGTYFDALTFVFFNAMGELNMEGFEKDALAWTLFFLCAMINLIVMLNLLIAIISETYDKVASTQDEYALKEKAGVVADLRDFAFFRYFVGAKDPRNYLFIAINEEAEHLADQELNIYDVHDQVVTMKKEVMKNLKEIREDIRTRVPSNSPDVVQSQTLKRISAIKTQSRTSIRKL